MPQDPQHLRSAFDTLFATLSPRHSSGLDPLFNELLTLYSAPSRHYHNLTHLDHCLRELKNSPTPDQPALALALWFHDAIYDPTRPDNEQRSADLAANRLSALNLPPDLIATVHRLILATKHAAAPAQPDEQLIVDIDLAILGQPPAIFNAYERNIRQEYAHVPDAAFRTGRAAVLQKFLARPAIYTTSHFHALYETHARQNLARSTTRLNPS